ncbi:MAG TPA: aminotransferase class V-fold PLP-dependent enzyme [Phycisphaerales bacterium]|nr:aminotransferase class V-fold PLP-dependent enzyme [Phycisphaerales bacterium]
MQSRTTAALDTRTLSPALAEPTGLLDDLDRALNAAAAAGHAPIERLERPAPAALHQWALDPSLTFLNHGSYGATPKSALRAQSAFRERFERDPVRLLKFDLERMMDATREKLGEFLNCNPADLAPFRNATWAIGTVLRAAGLRAGDEVLVTDHEYGSLYNELERMSALEGIKVVKAQVPFPIASHEVAKDRVLSLVSHRTRLVIVSQVTSASAMILPVAGIVRELNERGIDSLIDGAHSPGQIGVDVRALNPTYFVASGHKWLSGPKGSAFVYVHPDRQARFRPLSLSARANKIRPERALFLRDFDYQGTDDYSAFCCLPASVKAVGEMHPGGWPGVMRQNHETIVRARRVVCGALGVEPHTPDAMIGSMCSIKLPEPPAHMRARPTCYDDALQDVLLEKYRIVTPIWRLPSTDERVIRISAQLYNTPAQYEYLAAVLKTELALEQAGR